MTPATSPASSTRRSSSPTTTTSPSASAKPPSARSCAALACPACSSMPARCRWKPRRSAFPAATSSSSAATCNRPARATPPCSAACWRTGSASTPKTIEHRHGDTDLGLTGFASVGSRSAMCAGAAIVVTADTMLAKGKKIAAAALEASESDIQYRERRLRGGRHRPQDLAVRHRAPRQGDGREPRHQGQGRSAADVSERLPHRRDRDRSRHRQVRHRHLHGGRRLRQRARPDRRRRPGAGLDRQRPRPGADRERGLRFDAADSW